MHYSKGENPERKLSRNFFTGFLFFKLVSTRKLEEKFSAVRSILNFEALKAFKPIWSFLKKLRNFIFKKTFYYNNQRLGPNTFFSEFLCSQKSPTKEFWEKKRLRSKGLTTTIQGFRPFCSIQQYILSEIIYLAQALINPILSLGDCKHEVFHVFVFFPLLWKVNALVQRINLK